MQTIKFTVEGPGGELDSATVQVETAAYTAGADAEDVTKALIKWLQAESMILDVGDTIRIGEGGS